MNNASFEVLGRFLKMPRAWLSELNLPGNDLKSIPGSKSATEEFRLEKRIYHIASSNGSFLSLRGILLFMYCSF